MNSFFSSLFSWWGSLSLYTNDMRDYMSGFDSLTNEYTGSARFAIAGLSMLFITGIVFSVFYFVIRRAKFSQRKHWFISLALSVLLSGLVTLIIALPAIDAAKEADLLISFIDCAGFAASAMIWSAILYVLLSISPFPRRLSTHCSYTPWKQ